MLLRSPQSSAVDVAECLNRYADDVEVCSSAPAAVPAVSAGTAALCLLFWSGETVPLTFLWLNSCSVVELVIFD